MEYQKETVTKTGKPLLIRHGEEKDGAEVVRSFLKTHGETDYLTTYPEESAITLESEIQFLRATLEDPRSAELVAEIDGKIVGVAGISPVRNRVKLMHRAAIGISVEKAYWRMGIGRALLDACLECAQKAGYLQAELEVVGENAGAIALYKKLGFQEYGRNPWGFRKKNGEWQEVVHMRKPLL